MLSDRRNPRAAHCFLAQTVKTMRNWPLVSIKTGKFGSYRLEQVLGLASYVAVSNHLRRALKGDPHVSDARRAPWFSPRSSRGRRTLALGVDGSKGCARSLVAAAGDAISFAPRVPAGRI